MSRITVTVDGVSYADDVEPRMLLVHYLREVVGKTGTPVGCDSAAMAPAVCRRLIGIRCGVQESSSES